MALSPPKASSAGLRARQAAKSDTTASTLIHGVRTTARQGVEQSSRDGQVRRFQLAGQTVDFIQFIVAAQLAKDGECKACCSLRSVVEAAHNGSLG